MDFLPHQKINTKKHMKSDLIRNFPKGVIVLLNNTIRLTKNIDHLLKSALHEPIARNSDLNWIWNECEKIEKELKAMGGLVIAFSKKFSSTPLKKQADKLCNNFLINLAKNIRRSHIKTMGLVVNAKTMSKDKTISSIYSAKYINGAIKSNQITLKMLLNTKKNLDRILR